MSCSWRLGMWCLWFHLRTLRSRWVGETGCEHGPGGAKGASWAASFFTNSWLAESWAISLWLGAGKRAGCPWAWDWLLATEGRLCLFLGSGDVILHKACGVAMGSCPYETFELIQWLSWSESTTEPILCLLTAPKLDAHSLWPIQHSRWHWEKWLIPYDVFFSFEKCWSSQKAAGGWCLALQHSSGCFQMTVFGQEMAAESKVSAGLSSREQVLLLIFNPNLLGHVFL